VVRGDEHHPLDIHYAAAVTVLSPSAADSSVSSSSAAAAAVDVPEDADVVVTRQLFLTPLAAASMGSTNAGRAGWLGSSWPGQPPPLRRRRRAGAVRGRAARNTAA
jgi:hypothetical protein